MPDLLLTTKLSIPSLRKDVLSRPHLIERMDANLLQDDGFGRRLTLVSAPAGYG